MSDVCGHPKADGSGTCGSPVALCPDCGHCLVHCEHREEEMQAARSKGGKETRKRYGADGLKDEELPPLDSPEHAERWLEIIGRAVGTGRLAHNDGQAMIRAVQEFLRSQRHDLEGDLSDAREKLEEYRARENRADLKAMD